MKFAVRSGLGCGALTFAFVLCGLRNGGEPYCWGSYDQGEIGDGTAFSATPIVVK